MQSSLTEALREHTRELHTRVERSGFMRALLRGQIDRPSYCVLLRNLREIYLALESGLARHAQSRAIAPVHLPGLARSAALARDLGALHGPDWPVAIAVLPAADAYVQRLHELADGDPQFLVAHAYVRYLGDMSGGQLVRKVVQGSLRLDGAVGADFYDFGSPEEAAELARSFRVGLDAIPIDAQGIAALVREARRAFCLHEELFAQIQAQRCAGATPARPAIAVKD